MSPQEAVAPAEVMITAIPGRAVVSTLELIGGDVLGDKIVLDPSAAFSAQMTMAYPDDSVAHRCRPVFRARGS